MKYGMTLEDFEALLAKQEGVCAACGKPETRLAGRGKLNLKPRPLSVDHNHTTGEVRGLLCFSCNLALGHLEDNLDRIKALYRYRKNFGP